MTTLPITRCVDLGQKKKWKYPSTYNTTLSWSLSNHRTTKPTTFEFSRGFQTLAFDGVYRSETSIVAIRRVWTSRLNATVKTYLYHFSDECETVTMKYSNSSYAITIIRYLYIAVYLRIIAIRVTVSTHKQSVLISITERNIGSTEHSGASATTTFSEHDNNNNV